MLASTSRAVAVIPTLEAVCHRLRALCSSLAEPSSRGDERASPAAQPSKFLHSEYPAHYRDIPVINAAYRHLTGFPTGTWASRKLRVKGFVTGALESLPFRQPNRLLLYPHNEIRAFIDHYGETFTNQICLLNIVALDELIQLMQPNDQRDELFATGWRPTVYESFQVLPRRVQISPVLRDLQNVTMMNCPDDRVVHCKVRVTTLNADESPCVKRGGAPLIIRQFIKVRTAATNIPLTIPVECSALESGEAVRVGDLQLAEGQHVVGLRPEEVVLKMEGGKKPKL